MNPPEVFISVDIEAAGPYPGRYSMLTLGACLIDDPDRAFAVAFKPVSYEVDAKALAVTGLSLEELAQTGVSPADAMRQFADWVAHIVPKGAQPVFVGLNAAFDWAFVNHYFLEFLGENPFGFAALDIKALYMGAFGGSWRDSRSSVMRRELGAALEGDHEALHDAIAQAELFRLIRSHVAKS